MSSPQQREISERASESEGRANIHEFLSRCYLEEIDKALLHALESVEVSEVMRDWGGFDFRDALAADNEEELLEELAFAYCNTFVTGEGPVFSPHESVWKSGCLEGKATLEVEAFYARCLLELPDSCPEFADHLGVELDFMCRLTRKEASCLRKGDNATAAECRDQQRDFLKEHLLVWGPDFSSRIERWASHPFYRLLGKITGEFFKMEAEAFELKIELLSSYIA